MRRPFVRPARALVAAASVLSLVVGVAASPAHAAAGDLDSSFGGDGIVNTDFGGYDGAAALAVQPDGKIVVAGHTSGQRDDSVLARYNANGSLDAGFGDGGIVKMDLGGYDALSAVAVQPDGRIVVAGYNTGSADNAVVARFNADGTLNANFGSGGVVSTDFGGYDGLADLAIQPDGKIVVAGYTYGSTEDAVVARYNTTGTLDLGFGSQGITKTNLGGYDSASAVALQSDGKIVIAGSTYGQGDDAALARYSTNGTLDTEFGSGGIAKTDLGGYDSASDLAFQPDGKIVIAGSSYGSTEDAVVARYSISGTLDSGFGSGGIAKADLGGYDSASALALQPDGKIVIAGSTYGQSDDAAVARFRSDGTLDSGFGGDGVVNTHLGGYDSASDLALQSDGKIVISGSTSGQSDDAALARYQVSSGGGGSAPNSSPSAGSDAATTYSDQPVVIPVLANDTDGNGDTLTISSVSMPAGGVAGISGNQIRYVPASGFYGTDTFTYVVSDGKGGTSTGTVTVTVHRLSDGVPVADGGTVQSATQATPAVPVAVGITSPNSGQISIADVTNAAAPSGFTMLGRTLRIQAPAATAADPLRLTFRVERTVLEAAGGSPSTVTVFRNGVPAGECPASTTAVPDPCVTSRSIDTNTDDVVVVVLAAHASDWALGVATGPKGDGYWMLGRDGKVYSFGKAAHLGEPSAHRAPGASFVDLEPTPAGDGYWIVDDQGRIYAYNAAGFSNVNDLGAGEQVTSISATPNGKGLWVFTNKGRVIVRGEAKHYGDMAGTALNGPVLDSIAAPGGTGYYMVASDGGVFTFGTARFEGSMGGKRLNAPVQSLVPDPDGSGYWLVASDGGVFAFAADFRGSMGAAKLNRPMAGMVPYGTGYLMVAEDGGIFDFSPDKDFLGSLGANPPAIPVISVAIH